MHPKLQRILNTLETDRKHLLRELADVSDQWFNSNPLPGKWSISQILTHIITSERLTLLYMKKKSLGIDQLDNFRVDRILQDAFAEGFAAASVIKIQGS